MNVSEILPDLFLFEDCCNVYLIRSGESGLAVDFGSGRILGHLDQIGVRRLEWIVHTHHHRDQCQGDEPVEEAGCRIAVPEYERHLFDEAEKFWQNKQIYINYDLRSTFMTLPKNLPTDVGLSDGDIFDWEGIQLRVIHTPAHTEGSISLLAEMGGRRVLFCGDIIHSPGKILNFYDLQWEYCHTVGLKSAIQTFRRLMEEEIDLILPSHGRPIHNPKKAMGILIERLEKLDEIVDWRSINQPRSGRGLQKVTPHILVDNDSTSFFVLSPQGGRAFMVDCGYFNFDKISILREQFGVKRIDFIIVSHFHDDHVAGINRLREEFGAELYLHESMVDIFLNPSRYNLPCLWPDPIPVDRIIKDEEVIDWQGLKLLAFHMPGQTDYSMGLFGEIDGIRVLFEGDNIPTPKPGCEMRGQVCCRNHLWLDGGFLKSAEKMMELNPRLMLTSHWDPFEVKKEDLRRHLDWARRLREILAELLPYENPQFGVDPDWVCIYPYQSEVSPGGRVELEIAVRNHFSRPASCEIRMSLPDGWRSSPEKAKLDLQPRSIERAIFSIDPPEYAQPKRYICCADVIFNGQYYGQLKEAIVQVKTG